MTVATEKLITLEINKPARYLGNKLIPKYKPWDKEDLYWVLTYLEI
jgi:hypothetical protein